MSIKVEVRRTADLSPEERLRLCALFEEVFHKSCPESVFLRKYAAAWLGSSFHALARRDGRIAGAYSAIVVRYRFFDRDLLFAIPADLMIEKAFRGNMRAVVDLSNALYGALAKAGVACMAGSLRDEMAQFHERIGNWKIIGEMPYYVAPLRGPHVPGAAALMRGLVRIVNLAGERPACRTPAIYKVDDSAFRAYRYGIFPTEYRKISARAGEGIYTGRLFYEIPDVPRGVRFSLLVDVNPLTPAAFEGVVRAIRRKEPEIDYLAYQGTLSFRPKTMWRVAPRFARPHWRACVRVLRPEMVDERIYDIDNWNLNLSNGDIV